MAGAVQISIVGNMTADPEVRTVGNGSVTNLTIAVTERQFDRDANEFVEKGTSFYRCSAWRELGEHAAASLSKGDRVVAQGTLRQREYEKDGEKRQAWEVELDEIAPSLRFATATVNRVQRNGNQQQRQGQYAQQQRGGQQQRQQPAQQQVQQQWSAPSAYDSETPF